MAYDHTSLTVYSSENHYRDMRPITLPLVDTKVSHVVSHMDIRSVEQTINHFIQGTGEDSHMNLPPNLSEREQRALYVKQTLTYLDVQLTYDGEDYKVTLVKPLSPSLGKEQIEGVSGGPSKEAIRQEKVEKQKQQKQEKQKKAFTDLAHFISNELPVFVQERASCAKPLYMRCFEHLGALSLDSIGWQVTQKRDKAALLAIQRESENLQEDIRDYIHKKLLAIGLGNLKAQHPEAWATIQGCDQQAQPVGRLFQRALGQNRLDDAPKDEGLQDLLKLLDIQNLKEDRERLRDQWKKA